MTATTPTWEAFQHADTYRRHQIVAAWRDLPAGARVDQRIADHLRDAPGLQRDYESDVRVHGPNGWAL